MQRLLCIGSRPINNIHEAVKSELIRNGIEPDRIHPTLGESKPELKLTGFIKQKFQDVCITPDGYSPENEYPNFLQKNNLALLLHHLHFLNNRT